MRYSDQYLRIVRCWKWYQGVHPTLLLLFVPLVVLCALDEAVTQNVLPIRGGLELCVLGVLVFLQAQFFPLQVDCGDYTERSVRMSDSV